MKTEIVNFYETQIPCVQIHNQIMVAVRPICIILNLDEKNQYEAIRNDEILKDVVGEHLLHDSIGREQKSIFLPLHFLHGWLFQIKLANTMSEYTKQMLITFKRECYNILFNHFNKKIIKQLDANKIEIELLKQINELTDKKVVITDEIKEKKKILEKIREERLNNEPTLF